jgi:hypothetical protein
MITITISKNGHNQYIKRDYDLQQRIHFKNKMEVNV